MRRYVVTVGGRDFVVSIDLAQPGMVRVEVDGRPYQLRAQSVSQNGVNRFVWVRDGKVVPIESVTQSPGNVWVSTAGQTIGMRAIGADRHRSSKRSDSVGSDGVTHVRATIPGRVVRCLVKAGDQVQSGQGLVIVEAMKMENELRASHAGVVREISVQEGQAVEAGESLLQLAGQLEKGRE